MPQNVRNFWIEADIDGRRTTLEGGPRSRDGGFSLTIFIRDNGSILRAVEMRGFARSDGTLSLDVSQANDVFHSETATFEPNESGCGGFTLVTQSGRSSAPRQRRVHNHPERQVLPIYESEPLAPWELELLENPEPEIIHAPLGRDPFGKPY